MIKNILSIRFPYFFIACCCILFSVFAKPAEIKSLSSKIDPELKSTYIRLGVAPSSIKIIKGKGFLYESIRIPKNKPLVEAGLEIWNVLNRSGFADLDGLEKQSENQKQIVFTFTDDLAQNRKIILSYGKIGSCFSLALILNESKDSEPEWIQKFTALSPSFAYIVPADSLKNMEKRILNMGEIFLELPLEKREIDKNRKDIIYLHSSDVFIRKRLQKLWKIPYSLAGITPPSNTIILSDVRVMKIILEDAKKHKTFFYEDRPLQNSVAAKTAKSMGVPYLASKYVIDGKNHAQAVATLKKLCVVAEKAGKAVAKVVVNKETYFLMKESLPELQKQGICLTVPSKLILADSLETKGEEKW